MKKFYLLLILLVTFAASTSAQVISYIEAPLHDGGTTPQRAPNGQAAFAYLRACALVLQTELTAIGSNNTITAFGFTLNTGTASQAVTGAFTLYLQNTTDVAYSKSTTWGTAITGMTQVYASAMTIPVSASSTSITLTLSTPFVYTGGGVYVAYDWACPGPYDVTGATYLTNYLSLTPGCNSAASNASSPTTLTGASSHRPSFLFGVPNLNTNDMQFIGIEAPGRVPAMLNTAHTIKGIVKNASNTTLSGVNVNLNVGGANPFASVVTIPSLAAGAFSTVSFAAYNPMTPGLNNMTVSLSSDQNNNNNQGTYIQTVTCNEWAYNPPTNNYTNSVGFNTGSGIIGCSYNHAVTTTLTALRCSISTNAATAGNSTWGVLLSASGAIIATTNTISITNGMLGTQQVLAFASPPVLAGGTTYYFGFAQPVGAVGYFPAAALTFPYVSQSIYITTALTGGVLTPLAQNLGYFGIEAIFQPTITLTAASQTVVCGAQTTVNALSSSNYSWNTGATTASFIITPTITTNYTVMATNTLGCMVTKTLGIAITPITVSASTSNTIICLGQSVTISALGAGAFQWNTGPNQTAASFIDNPLSTTIYSVVGTNTTGCSNTGSVMVIVQSFTGLQLSATSLVICKGNTLTVSANGAATYTWNLGASSYSTPAVVDQPLANVIYTVIGADNLGCEMTKTVNVTVNSVTFTVAQNPPICVGTTATLVPTGASTYTWVGFSFPNLVVTPTTTSSYTLFGSGANTCTNSLIVTVTVNPNPTITAVSSRSTMCKGETTTLSVTGAANYTWTGGLNNASFVVTTTLSGSPVYTVAGIDANNCAGTGSLTYKVNACLGLETNGLPSLVKVFPNPSSGLLILDYQGTSDGVRTMVHSINGALIWEAAISQGESAIDLSGQAPGLYFITVVSPGEEPVRIKVVKE